MKENVVLYIFLLLGWMVLTTFWYTCHIKNVCISESFIFTEGKVYTAQDHSPGLKIIGTNIGVDDNIRFKRSSPDPMMSSQIKLAFNSVQSYLTYQPDKALEVTGIYSSKEDNPSLVDNLGLARAETFKAWLSLQGIDRKQIMTGFQQSDSLTFHQDTLRQGLYFRIVDLSEKAPVDKVQLETIKERLIAHQRPFYFEPASFDPIIDDSIREYVQDLSVYLAAYPDKMITLLGHTDDTGNKENNFRVGKMQADAVRQLLSESGIPSQQIRTNSRGNANPVTTEETRQKRQQNYRVEIQID